MIDALTGNTATTAAYSASALVAPTSNSANFADTLSTDAADATRKAGVDARNTAREEALQGDPTERRRRLAEISSRYDVTNISPNELDKMNNELYEAGYEPASDLFNLWNRGAEFERALAYSAAEHFGQPIDQAELDRRMTTRFDFMQATRDQRQFAAQAGDPTETYDRVLRGLENVSRWGSDHERKLESTIATDNLGIMLTTQEQAATRRAPR